MSNKCTLASRRPSMAPHRGASSGLSIRVYSIPWPPSCPGALPTRCIIESAPLLAFAVDAAIQNALRRESHTCTQEESQQVGKGLTRLPADTPRTPSSKSVDFQQVCDRLRTDLPGDSSSARFVAGDPGARFGAAAPLEYEITEEIGHPH